VFPGDVILGDSDGVIVIPAHLADEIADETFEMTAFEDLSRRKSRRAAAFLDSIRQRTRRRSPISPPGAKQRGDSQHDKTNKPAERAGFALRYQGERP
jgi:hypothetical protein